MAIISLGIKHTSISFMAVALKLVKSSATTERCPITSPLLVSFTICSFPLLLSLDSFDTPSLTQYTPSSFCPSTKRESPFLIFLDILESETFFNSSLLNARSELNCRTIQFSHLLSMAIFFIPNTAKLLKLRIVKTDNYHVFSYHWYSPLLKAQA